MTTIDVYADIWCPFAYVGLRSTLAMRDRLGRADVALRVRAWPLELVNQAPMDPQKTAEHVEVLRDQVAHDLFRGFDPTNFPTTSLPALAVSARAYRDSIKTGEAMVLALREALFENGLDISSPEVLKRVSQQVGVGTAELEDRESVLSDYERGKELGVKGSPHFFCGEDDMFCPSLDISRNEEGHMQVRRNAENLEAFLTKCMSGTRH